MLYISEYLIAKKASLDRERNTRHPVMETIEKNVSLLGAAKGVLTVIEEKEMKVSTATTRLHAGLRHFVSLPSCPCLIDSTVQGYPL